MLIAKSHLWRDVTIGAIDAALHILKGHPNTAVVDRQAKAVTDGQDSGINVRDLPGTLGAIPVLVEIDKDLAIFHAGILSGVPVHVSIGSFLQDFRLGLRARTCRARAAKSHNWQLGVAV